MKIDLKSIKKILIVQYQPFGDVLLNTGYFSALRDKFPHAKIDYLVKKKYKVVLENNPYLDELILFEDGKGLQYIPKRIKMLRDIRKRKYDLIIDQIRGVGSAQIALFSGAKYRLGFEHKKYAFLYNIRAKRKSVRYHSSMKFDALLPLGIEERPHKLYFNIKAESFEYIDNWLNKINPEQKKIITISPGSPVAKKKWCIGNYARLGDLIMKNNEVKVVILWAPNEKADAEKLYNAMENKPVMAPPTDLNQAAAMLKRSALLICNDGGLNHLSVATGTPSIAIFGSVKPYRWSPDIFEGHYHFYNEKHDSLKDDSFGIEPESVYQKVQEIIK
jgi:heptosyltransferase III